jgi:hypothetical protein
MKRRNVLSLGTTQVALTGLREGAEWEGGGELAGRLLEGMVRKNATRYVEGFDPAPENGQLAEMFLQVIETSVA